MLYISYPLTSLTAILAWIPAEPGHREPVANVPISILQIMNRNSDQCAARSTASRKSKGSAYHTKTPAISRRQSLQSAGNDGQEDSESDIPISSGQWPQSPDRNQLPPDSSMDSTVHSDHLAQAEPVQTVSGTQTRRSSYASVSSNLASPLRPSPMLLTSPSRNSEESSPRPKSAGLFSPSIVSNSAGEETLEFRCRAIGCDKSYNKASALMYHIEVSCLGVLMKSADQILASAQQQQRPNPDLQTHGRRMQQVLLNAQWS